MSGRWDELDQLLHRVDNLSRAGGPTETNLKREPTVLIDHIEELEYLCIRRLVELEVDRPDRM